MPYSAVERCNAALRRFGDRTITALTDNSPQARACSARFDAVRDALLRAHPWNFAVRRTALAADATAPAWGFANAYTLPADCLRVLRIANDEDAAIAWTVEGRQILTDEGAPLNIRYMTRVEDVTQWDALFAEAFSAALAVEVAAALAESETIVRRLAEQAERTVRAARRSDALEGTADGLPEGSWIDARTSTGDRTRANR